MPPVVVLIAGKDPTDKPGGHSSYVRAHARAAMQLGFEPHIFCVAAHAETIATDFGTVHRVASPFRPFRQIMIPGHARFLSAGVARFLERSAAPGPHLLHSFGLWGCAGVSAQRRLRRKGIATVAITNAYTTYEHEARGKVAGLATTRSRLQKASHTLQLAWVRMVVGRYEDQAYTRSRLVVVNYDSVHRILEAQYRTRARVRKLPYASEAAFRPDANRCPAGRDEPEGGTPRLPVIVAVSRHDPRKGVNLLLLALARLRDREIAFRAQLVGGGILLEAHRQLARELRLEECVSIEGWVPDPNVYLRQADIFVLPSLEEGSGSISLLEAMQAGVAIVASDLDGIPEDVTHTKDGLLVPPGDVAALTDALALLLADDALRQRLALSGRDVFQSRFSASAFADALGALYAELGFPPEGHTAAPNRDAAVY